MVYRSENESNRDCGSENSSLPTPKEWPDEGKENVRSCPVCGGAERSFAHPELTDRIFFCAPGVWSLYRCDACRCGYLDPRPTPDAIGLAYAEYYTHAAPQEVVFLSSSTFVGRRLAFLRNGYLNARFPRLGLTPSHPLGFKFIGFCPATRALAERDVRHLPAPSEGAKLLDIYSAR